MIDLYQCKKKLEDLFPEITKEIIDEAIKSIPKR